MEGRDSSSSHLLSWLFQQQYKGISFRLEAIQALLEALGDPQKKQPVFHIAGTNGKGSVSACAASLLQAAGVRIGLYTSPHLVDFRERIRLQGEMISLEELEQGIRRLQALTQGWKVLPTFFELTTALAFECFARHECEVIVLETGMGGRLDATNAATQKIACAFTPISLDHQEWLGSSLAEIAREKAGIMRPGVPVITAPQPEEVMHVLQEEAMRMDAPFTIVSEPLSQNVSLALAGSYQRWNAALALKLVEQGPWKFSQSVQKRAFASVSWPGRFQRISLPSSRELILDGAHNPAAVEQLVATWRELFPNQRCTLLFGALADKEWKKMLLLLEPISSEMIFVPVASPRAVALAEMIHSFPQATTVASLHEALAADGLSSFFGENHEISASTKKSEKNLPFKKNSPAPILLTGSLFLVAEALAFLQGKAYHSSSQ